METHCEGQPHDGSDILLYPLLLLKIPSLGALSSTSWVAQLGFKCPYVSRTIFSFLCPIARARAAAVTPAITMVEA